MPKKPVPKILILVEMEIGVFLVLRVYEEKVRMNPLGDMQKLGEEIVTGNFNSMN